jgi:serpin B
MAERRASSDVDIGAPGERNMGRPAASRRHPGHARLALVVVIAVVAGACNATTPTPPPVAATPVASASVTPTAELPSPTATASATASAPPSPVPSAPPAATASFVRGDAAVTVSPGLRVRSRPRVADDSLKLEPLLPVGTELAVLGGPVTASGYAWYDVAPIGVTLAGGLTHGWVAVAATDGTPWVAAAATPGLELTSASATRAPASVADARAQAAAVNAFGLGLYRRMLRSPSLALASKGVVISPTSIAMALAMARAGAAGTTATEMDRLLNVPGWDRLGAGMGALDRLLVARDAAWIDDEGIAHELALRIANMAFDQRGYAIEPAFLQRISRTFGAGLGLVDYMNQTEAARGAINDWVGRQTLGRIPQLLSAGDIDTLTRLVLVNAVYMKANWAREFAVEDTAGHPFTRLDGSKVSVPTMHLTGQQDVVLAHGAGWLATELGYTGANGSTPLAMTLILPDNLPAFEASLTTGKLAAVQASITAEQKRLARVTYKSTPGMDCGTYPYAVSLSLPKFGIDTRASLVPVLQSMGLNLATDPSTADFSGMTTADRLYISKVIHQANIDVDEKGTTAAAATAVVMTTGGCTGPDPAKTVSLRFNRPFLFVVRDLRTGAILFMGRVVDPTSR